MQGLLSQFLKMPDLVSRPRIDIHLKMVFRALGYQRIFFIR